MTEFFFFLPDAVLYCGRKRRKIMTRKRLIIIIVLAAALILGAGAGIWMYVNRFDAGEYVQAVLDVSYKNETELYVEITGVSQEDAQKIFEDNLDATMKGFESSDMPEDLQPKYRELIGTIAKKTSYTVNEPVRQKDGTYEVTVTVKPITLFTDTYADFQVRAEDYAAQITDSVMQGAEMPTEEEMQNQIYQIYYDVLKETVDSGMLYGRAEDVTLHVARESSRRFTIDEEDMDQLDGMLIESVGDDAVQSEGAADATGQESQESRE